jgi:hypothetical protein
MHAFRLLLIAGVFLVGSAVSDLAAAPPPCPIRLSDVTDRSGVTFRHFHGGDGQQYIVEFMVAGVALLDYDGDGWIDIYFLNGAPLRGTRVASWMGNRLYRNLGDGRFADVTESAGVGDRGHALGVAAGDYDNDGNPDLYVNNFGPNVLFCNNGDGTFRRSTEEAGVANGDQFGAGVCFLDADADGNLDLYVGNYVGFSYAQHDALIVDAFPYPPGPGDYPPVPDTLFRNLGDGRFTDVSAQSGIARVAGPTMGTVCGDFDDDGDADIFVCNDGRANFFFQNDGSGRFTEAGVFSCLAYNVHGNENGSMGADCGDFDNDGYLDLFMTNYTGEMRVLYRNLGGGFFEDATTVARAGNVVFPHTKWGSGLVDFDNDGDRDLFIACGHFLTNIREIDDRTSYDTRNFLLMNTGDARFADVSDRCGDGLRVAASSRGTGFDDLDNDGDIDVVVLNTNTRPTVLRNDSATDGHWLQVRLVGVRDNRDGIGARVRVMAGDLVQVAEVHSGRGYQSHHGTRLHFGLGSRERADRVEVRWSCGEKEVFTNVGLDQLVVLIQGTRG